MARYQQYTNASSETLFISEEHSLYGSARIGVDGRKDTLYKAGAYTPAWCGTSSARRELGNKHYELSNHLGNVLLSITDKKAYKTLSGSLYFEAEITTISDYYPFGSAMRTRAYSAVGYRWGFGGHEIEHSVYNSLDYYNMEPRVYDARIGRTLIQDPAKQLYPGITPYAYALNTPLQAIDPDGQVIIFINGLWGSLGAISSPKEGYWIGYYNNKTWVQGLKDHWGDQKTLFFDGSVGGQSNLKNNISPEYRWVEGRKAGYSSAKSIIDNLSAGETIKFVTNSMGAAFQRGFSNGLQYYINELQLGNINTQIGLMKNITEVENQIAYYGSTPLLEYCLSSWKHTLSDLRKEYQKLEKVKIELVVDIDPHNSTERDANSLNHYYILSEGSDYSIAEKAFLDIQPVKGAIDASKKADGTPVTKGHHSWSTNPTDLPKPKR